MSLSDLIGKYMELMDLLPDDLDELDKDSYLLMRQIGGWRHHLMYTTFYIFLYYH